MLAMKVITGRLHCYSIPHLTLDVFFFVKERVETEHVRRQFLCNSSPALKMESDFDATSERECSVCLFDLHLSAAGCH